MSWCRGAGIGQGKDAAWSPRCCAQQWDGDRTTLLLGPSYLQGYPSYGSTLPLGPFYLQGYLSYGFILPIGAILPMGPSYLQGHLCCRILCLAMETRHQHIREYTRIKIIGCYRNRRQMILFADSLMVPCRIIGCQRVVGTLHRVLLQLSSVTTDSTMLRK